MKYMIKNIICVKIKNGEIVPFAFNNSATKIKNLLTNEIVDLNSENQSLYSQNSRWRYMDCFELRKVFYKIFGECDLLDLADVLSTGCPSDFYLSTHRSFIEEIEMGSDRYCMNDKTCVNDTDVLNLVKLTNKFLRKQKKITKRIDEKELEEQQEAENSQEF